MELKIIGITSTDEKVIEETTREKLDLQGGHSANICYTQRDWEEIVSEPFEKTESRIIGNKQNNHGSVFGHGEISMYITGIPKLLAMFLNNEHEYNTSEKSARYTKMYPTEKELILYEKWITILENKIKQVYPNEPYLEPKIHKLAMENARYMISVMTPTKMEYTTSYRQWNYLYHFLIKLGQNKQNIEIIEMLKPSIKELKDLLKESGIIDTSYGIEDYRDREFSLIVLDNDYREMFGRSYSTNYMASFASVAQQQRHRTLDYNIVIPEERTFVVPPIIENDSKLKEMWLYDIASLSNLYPQGMLVQTNETGKYEDFTLKLQERLCSAAQLETCMQNYQTLLKYTKALRGIEDKRNKKILEELEKYEVGARCLAGYRCANPCGFKEGISLTRKI